MFKSVLIAKLLKMMKTFKLFGLAHKANNLRIKMKYRKQSQKCHLLARQLAELDYEDADIRHHLCQARDLLYKSADMFSILEDNYE